MPETSGGLPGGGRHRTASRIGGAGAHVRTTAAPWGEHLRATDWRFETTPTFSMCCRRTWRPERRFRRTPQDPVVESVRSLAQLSSAHLGSGDLLRCASTTVIRLLEELRESDNILAQHACLTCGSCILSAWHVRPAQSDEFVQVRGPSELRCHSDEFRFRDCRLHVSQGSDDSVLRRARVRCSSKLGERPPREKWPHPKTSPRCIAVTALWLRRRSPSRTDGRGSPSFELFALNGCHRVRFWELLSASGNK
jgi:hypothetical protein